MGSYALTVEADEDIQGIAEYSVQQWGLERAERYILGLHEAFRRLADFPDMGRDASHVRAGYWRMDSGSHAVFYKKTEAGVLIVRVLYQMMDFGRHLR